MLQQVVPRQDEYIQNRASALQNVESTISELGGIFTQLATMVSQQGELAIRLFFPPVNLYFPPLFPSFDVLYIWACLWVYSAMILLYPKLICSRLLLILTGPVNFSSINVQLVEMFVLFYLLSIIWVRVWYFCLMFVCQLGYNFHRRALISLQYFRNSRSCYILLQLVLN